MAEVIEGNYSGRDLRIGIVVSRFNEFVTKAMLDGALNELRRAGASDALIRVVWVPGAYEIPLACQRLAASHAPDAMVALGCVIRGETTHYEHIAQSVAQGIQRVSLDQNIPIGFGVLTVEDMAQALDRAGGKMGNKGRDAARSALEMARVLKELKSSQEKEDALKEFLAQETSRP